MSWYYAIAGERKGPVTEEQFQALAQQGVVTQQTLVWRDGMAAWAPYGTVAPDAANSTPPCGAPEFVCAGCGGSFSASDVIVLEGQPYCAQCKPAAIQRLKEGVPLSGGAERVRKECLKHEAAVKSVGILYYLGSVIFTVAGLARLFVSIPKGWAAGTTAGVVLVVLGVAQMIVAQGARGLKSWARIAMAVLSGIGLLAFPIGTIINAYILYLVLSKKGQMVFSGGYQTVIAQTPHIKYRTSPLVWLLLLILIGIPLLLLFKRR